MKATYLKRKGTDYLFEIDGDPLCVRLTSAQFAALREYFTRPKPLTPRQRALFILHEYANNPDCDLGMKIATAIEDAARLGVDWEETE